MAIMYPRVVPEYIRKDHHRRAEMVVYDSLEAQLPNDYICYYSRPWLGLKSDGEEIDGEADFVVAHRDFGMLVIEVKGGRVSRREIDGQWLSANKFGEYEIKDPVNQARSNKYNLLKKLRDMPGWGHRFITARHGVILPDSARPKKDLGADAPLKLFAFGDDMSGLKAWVEQRLSGADEEPAGNGFGADGLATLRQLLAVSFELRPHLGQALAADGKLIERLTLQQYNVLDSLSDNPQMAISGGAGTGKTLLAIEKAMRDAEAGKRTLLVCFNAALGNHLETLCNGVAGLDAGSFHSICGRLATKAGLSVSLQSQSPDFFETLLPNALTDAVTQNPELGYDAIIVDEGQDFRDFWLTALKLCLRDEDESEFYVFYDDNQRVYGVHGSFIKELPRSSFRLNQNLRNTREIHKNLSKWYAGGKVHSMGPEGIPVNWIECRTPEEQIAKISPIIGDHIAKNELRLSDIVVLSPLARDKSEVFQRSRIAGYPLGDLSQNDGKSLVCDTIRRFKGLERKCVIVTDAHALTENEMAYVALSRPSLLLYVLGAKPALERLQTAENPIPLRR